MKLVIVLMIAAALGLLGFIGSWALGENTARAAMDWKTVSSRALQVRKAGEFSWAVLPKGVGPHWRGVEVAKPAWCKGTWTMAHVPGTSGSAPACVYPAGVRFVGALSGWREHCLATWPGMDDVTGHKPVAIPKDGRGVPDTRYTLDCFYKPLSKIYGWGIRR